jgi:hypothetical protein
MLVSKPVTGVTSSSMDLIYLHGPPASGKLTIARELEARIGCGVFHNHLTIELVKPFFAFDTEPFWRMVLDMRLTALRLAAENGARLVTYTSCYSHPTDLPFFERIEGVIAASGGTIQPVYLQSSVPELERRIANPDRVALRKLRSVEGFRRELARWNWVAVPRPNCITIVTDDRTPSECADAILARIPGSMRDSLRNDGTRG